MRADEELAYLAAASCSRMANGYLRPDCPYCESVTGKPDRRKSFWVEAETGKYGCFKCHTRGRLSDVPTGIAGTVKAEPVWQMPPPEGYEELAGCRAIVTRPARQYIASRGIACEAIAGAKVGAVLQGWWRERIIVPCLDTDGKTWLGYVGRDWTDRSELGRYLYPKGMQRGQLLYNLPALFRRTRTPLLCVEGIFDALAWWPNACAFLGKPSYRQRDLLMHARRPLVVVLDGDAWAEGEALSAYLRLNGKACGWIRLPPCTDPNSCDRTWLQREIERVSHEICDSDRV